MIEMKLLKLLDYCCDEIDYDDVLNILEVKVHKTDTSKDLTDLMNALSETIPYPLTKFHSDEISCTFTYNTMEEMSK